VLITIHYNITSPIVIDCFRLAIKTFTLEHLNLNLSLF